MVDDITKPIVNGGNSSLLFNKISYDNASRIKKLALVANKTYFANFKKRILAIKQRANT